MMMNTKMSASNKTYKKAHTDLKQQEKPKDVINLGKCKRKVGQSCIKEWNNPDIKVDVKKGENTKEETPKCNHCQICGKKFKLKNNLKLHQEHHHPETKKDRYQCIGCNEGFAKVMDRQKHELKCEKNEKLSRLECLFCDLPCNTPKELRIHENKHRPIGKTKNYKNSCVCIECVKAFDSIPSLKVHIQRDHNSNIKPESTSNKETISIKEENTSNTLIDVSNLTNQLQYGRDHTEDNFEKKPSSMQVPQVNTELNKDEPFICLHCGSRFKYKCSKITHELKYHGKSEVTHTEDSRGHNTQESQILKKDESVDVVDKFGLQDKETSEYRDNNNVTHKIKEEIVAAGDDCSLPLADLGVPDKKSNRPSGRSRNQLKRKKCIGCDKVFDILKARDEHELECDLNCFNRKFNCMFCEDPFSEPKTLRAHENKHRPVKKTKRYRHRCVCIECNKIFDAIYTLRVHIRKKHGEGRVLPEKKKPFPCSFCRGQFTYEVLKHKHERKRHSADLDKRIGHGLENNVLTNFNVNNLSVPDGLPAVCISESGNVQHGDHNIINEEPCGEDSLEDHTAVNPVFNIKTEVDAPLNSPSGQYEGSSEFVVGNKIEDVDDMDKASCPSQKRKRKVKQPVERKQKKGSFVCNNCEAKFNSSESLWLHSCHQNMRTKSLSCIGCGKTFKNEADTKEHELKCIINHNEYNFNCIFCDETFGNPKLLRNHELKHKPRRWTKNNKCICIDCRKPFDSIDLLKKHIRVCHKSHVKVEEVYTLTDKRRPITVEDMKSCYVLLKDIDRVRAEKGKGIRKSCRAKSRRTKIDRVVSDAGCKPCSENGGHTVVGGVEDECTTGDSDISGECTVEDIKSELDNLNKAPASLVETESASPEELMQDEEAGSFQCGKCNSMFDSYRKLHCHSYSHIPKAKRLFCIGCGEGFEQSNDKDRHELECHVNLTNRYFNCLFCELPFDTPHALKNHEKKHRPPKQKRMYKLMCLCAECHRIFNAVSFLKMHVRRMHRGSQEKVKIKEEIEDVNIQSDLTIEEYKFDGDFKVEMFH